MKLTALAKKMLNALPGYRQRKYGRAVATLQTSKARIKQAATARQVYNPLTRQYETAYSQGVQKVLAYYDQEIDRLRSSYESATSAKQLPSNVQPQL